MIYAGPGNGPIAEDVPGDATVIPALPTAAGTSLLRAIAVVGAVLDALKEDPHIIAQLLLELADEVDEEIQQLSPERDKSVNPARQLREFVTGARVIHTAWTQPGLAVAELTAAVWSARGLASGYVSPEELPRALEEAPATRDIFYDPFLDEGGQVVPLKAVVWAQEEANLPHARAESCPASRLGDTAVALRLVVRGLAVTALDDQTETP